MAGDCEAGGLECGFVAGRLLRAGDHHGWHFHGPRGQLVLTFSKSVKFRSCRAVQVKCDFRKMSSKFSVQIVELSNTSPCAKNDS